MSFTDLASLAHDYRQGQQQGQSPPMGAPQPQGNDPGQPPDPKSFTLSPTNPASVSTQVASIDASSGTPHGLESNADLGDVSKTKDKTPDPNATEPAVYPPVIFPPTDYRQPAADRGPDGWGQKSDAVKMAAMYPNLAPGPDIPPPSQMYRESADASANMARYGAPGAAQLYSQGNFLMAPFAAMLDAISQGKFSRNYTAAALRGIEIRQREAILKTEEAMEQHQQYLSAFGTIFKQAEIIGTPAAYEEAKERTRQYIEQIQHGPLKAIFDSQGMRGVARYLNWEDAQLRRNMAAMSQARKVVDVDRDKRDEDALSGRASSPEGEAGALGVDPNRLSGRGGPEAPVTPTKDQSEPPAAAGPPLNPYEQRIAEEFGLNNPKLARSVIDAARSRMNRGNNDPKNDPIHITPNGPWDVRIGQVQQALQSRLDQIAAFNKKPAGMTQEQFQQQKLDAIRGVDPKTARAIEALGHYEEDPKTFQLAGGARAHAVDLVRSVYPNWNQNGFAVTQKYHDISNPTVRVIQRVGSFVPALNQLNTGLLRINPNSSPLGNQAEKLWNNTWTGDDKYPQLYSAIVNVIQEEQAIISGTGRPSVTLARERARHMLETMTPAQIQSQLFEDAATAYGMVKTINGQYKQEMGDPRLNAPFFPKETEDRYKAILRMNPHTGKLPSDAPADVLAAQPPANRPVPKWVHDQGLDWEPLTEEQVRVGRRMIQKYQTSTDPKTQADVQRTRARLGIFAVPDYPGQDDEDAGRPQ